MDSYRIALKEREPKLLALLTHRQWITAAMAGLLAAAIGTYFSFISPWIPLGFALAGVVTVHMIISCRYCLPLPQTAVLISTIYYVFAPIANIYYSTSNPLFRISDPNSYFGFAIPCLWATAFGWSLAFYRARPFRINESLVVTTPSLFRGLDVLIIGGMAIGFVMNFAKLPSSVATLGLLASNMRYIGVFGWALMARPGWKWRMGLVLTLDLFESVSTGFFLNFLLWAVNACVVIMFRHRFSTGRILLGMAMIVIFLPCFQHAKWELRKASWGVASGEQRLVVFGTTYHLNPFNKMPLLIAKVFESSITLLTGSENADFIADTAVRYNQGWIVARVQKHVPYAEEYANGKTVFDAAIASLVPRFLMPDKLTSGGGETFTRYTGVLLNANTSMNLGFVGEMYANYGYALGILACGFYGAFFGLIFQQLTKSAHSHIMVLSFIPYILNFAVVSEVGLVDVLNYTVKSLFVAAAIYAGVPAVFTSVNSYRAQWANQRARHYR